MGGTDSFRFQVKRKQGGEDEATRQYNRYGEEPKTKPTQLPV